MKCTCNCLNLDTVINTPKHDTHKVIYIGLEHNTHWIISTGRETHGIKDPPPSPFAGQNGSNGSAYGTPPNTGTQNNGGNYVPPPSPYANNGTGSPPPFANGGQQAFADDVKEFAKKYWWVWILLFLLPWWLCVIVFSVFSRNGVIEQKYRRIFLLSFIAALILPPW